MVYAKQVLFSEVLSQGGAQLGRRRKVGPERFLHDDTIPARCAHARQANVASTGNKHVWRDREVKQAIRMSEAMLQLRTEFRELRERRRIVITAKDVKDDPA